MTTASIGRTIAGFVIAPLVPGVLIAAAMAAAGEREEALGVLQASAIFGYPIALLLGVPSHLALLRSGWRMWWAYALAGAVLGAVIYTVMPVLIQTLMLLDGLDASGHVTFSASVLPAIAGCAAVAAVSFWLIARPDRARG